MILDEAALKYAKGLFQLTQEMNMLEDLEGVLACIEKSPKLNQLLCAHDYSKAEKKGLLISIFAKNIEPILVRFLSHVIEKSKFHLLKQITYQYRQLMLEKAGILEATLITAMPVSEENKANLASKLSTFYKKKVEIEIKIDPLMVAGAILIIANQMIDLSLNTQINHLTKQLLAAQI